MNLFFEYLKSIFTTWVTYLGLVPSIVAIVSTYTQYEITYISQGLLYSTALVFFLWANFKVWKSEKNKNASLQTQLANPVDYKFTIYAKKIILDESFLDKLAQENLQEIPDLLAEAEANIKEIERGKANRFRFAQPGISKEEDEQYARKLKKYIDELNAYKTNIEQGISEWKCFTEKKLSHLYEVRIEIENIGSVYDENISVEIFFGEGNKVINFEDIVNNLPKALDLPAKPKYKNKFSLVAQDGFLDLKNIEIPHSSYRSINIREKSVQVTLRELKASENCYLLRDALFIGIHDKQSIQATVLSKNSREKIKRKVGVVDGGEIALHERLMAYDFKN